MMSEDEFYDWFAQADLADLESYAEKLYQQYVKAGKFDALVEYGVDNWSGFGDAMQSLESEDEE